jgi:hypothetical protein
MSHGLELTMFEQQIEQTIALLSAHTIGDARTISFKEIEYSSMPQSLKRFFESEVQRWAIDERQRLVISPHFLYGDSQIHSVFDGITSKAADYAQFTREEFTTILDQAVKLVFNYLCRPQYTLTNFAFRDAANLSTDALLDDVGQFSEYEHYKAVLAEYFERKRVTGISRERFENLIALIDSEYVRSFDSYKLAHLTEPIFALFNPGDSTDFARVPIEALSVFYDDKNLTDIVEEIERQKAMTPSVTMHDLVMIIGNVDHTIGSDIRNIVTMHVTGAIPPAIASTVDTSSFDVPDIDAVIDADVQDSLPDEDIALPAGQVEAPEVELPDEFITDDEPLLSGEQITPGFEEIPETDTPEPVSEDLSIPDGFFLNDDENSLEADVPIPDLSIPEASVPEASVPEAHIASPSIERPLGDITLDEESFLRALDLTETGIVNTGTPYAMDADIPDISLGADEMKPDILESGTRVIEPSSPFIAPVAENHPETETRQADPQAVIAQFGDLRSSISSADKKKFAKKIFGKDDAAFERALETLNASPTWREASEHIDEIFLQHKVDMYSRIAVEFTDSIYKRYLQRK